MTAERQRTPPTRRRVGWPLLLLLGGGIFAVAATLFAVTGPLKGAGERRAVRYVEASVGAPSRINPLFVYLNDVDRDIAALVFSGLTRLAADGTVMPDLAQSWNFSPDGRSVAFHLRPGVRWHTGAPFTSADVLFTYSLLKNPEVAADPEQAPLWRELDCSAPDDLTVTCTLPEAFAPFLSYAATGILPKQILDGADVGQRILNDPFNRAPIGTGPFRVVVLDETHALLRANQQYHAGRPIIDEVELRFYPDTATAAADLMRRQADGLLLDLSAPEADYRALSSVDGLKAYSLNRSAYTVLYLNNNTPPLNDPAVRRAIARTVDVDAIIGGLLGGHALRAESPIVAGTWAFDPDAKPPSRNEGEARKALEDAGWSLPEGAKVRQRNGIALRLSLMTDQDELRGAVADEVARHLRRVGIEVTVVRQGSTNLIRDFLIPRQYQAAIFGWDPGPDPDPYPAWHSSQASGNGRNLAAYVSPDADELMEEARQIMDPEKRRQLYYRFQELFQEDVPSVLLFYPVYTYFVSEDVKGIESATLFFTSSRFGNIETWTVERTSDIHDQ